MSTPLRVLIVEDNEDDVLLLLRELRAGGYDPTHQHIQDAQSMTVALERQKWDIVIADYNLPQFSAPKALSILQELAVDIPFIVVSGTIGEETAVSMMKAGAQDYLIKGNLTRLVSAIQREVRDADNRRAARQAAIQQKRAEEAGWESEARLRRIVDSNMIGIMFYHIDGRITWANDAFLKVVGYTQEDVSAGRVRWDAMTPPEFREADVKAMEEIRRSGECTPFEKVFVHKNGQHMPVLLGMAQFEKSTDEGVKFVVDLTERKLLEEQLRQAQKMEAVGRLAGGIAHDFNNLLMAINGFADLILMRSAKEDKTYGEVKQIKEAGQRASALTRQLLAFSRKQVLQPIVLDLNGVVKGIEDMLKRLIGESIVFTTVLRSEKTVRTDAGQIEQVIMNLAVNAMDAMQEGGKLTIETADVLLEGDYLNHHYQVAPGAYVMLAVGDTGCGMDKETQAHIFEPFFTTKEVGKGTGLGLSMVYGIIKQSGGYIWVYSEPGQGTTFKIYLPIVEEPAQTLEPRRVSGELPGGTDTVLLVEDEDRVREFVHQLLASVGYTVLPARDGDEAIAMCERNTGPIQLLLTDIVMPRISGPALAERLKALYPNMKVIYMSGYTEEAILQRALLDHNAAFLQKPCSPAELAQRVREVLDAPHQFRR